MIPYYGKHGQSSTYMESLLALDIRYGHCARQQDT